MLLSCSMISGDLSTMSLPDLLQWADATSARGTLTLECASQTLWMQVERRTVVATAAPPSRAVGIEVLNPSVRPDSGVEPIDVTMLAVEQLFDVFLDAEGRFRFEANASGPADGVSVDLSLQELVMEGMRHLDEWPRLDRLYPSDAPRLRAAGDASTAGLSAVHRTLLECARREVTLSEARLSLGLSRPALLRRVEELRALGRVQVEGAPEGGDLIARLIGQATLLLKEKQFDEAAHVFGALLAADPGAVRVKQLLREAEREQVRALYQELPSEAVVVLAESGQAADRRLTATDRQVLERITGRWDVGVLVLASPLREVETLKSLRKLLRLGLVQLRRLPS